MFDFKPILYIYTTVEFNKIFRHKKKKKDGGIWSWKVWETLFWKRKCEMELSKMIQNIYIHVQYMTMYMTF